MNKLKELFNLQSKDNKLITTQKKIYQLQAKIITLNKEQKELLTQIENNNKKSDITKFQNNIELQLKRQYKLSSLQELLNNRNIELTEKISTLSASILELSQDKQDKTNKKKLVQLNKDLRKLNDEQEKHKIFVQQHKEKQEKVDLIKQEKIYIEEQKIEEANKKKELKKISLYKEEKDKLYSTINNILTHQSDLNKILTHLAKIKDNNILITFKEKVKVGLSATKFAANNLFVTFNAITSTPFYKKEGKIMGRLLTGKEQYDSSSPPFFIQLIRDKDTVEFLRKNTIYLDSVIDQVLPNITNILFKEFGKTEALEKKLRDNETELKKLTDDPKSFTKDLTSQDESKIRKLKSLQKKNNRALFLEGLKKNNINEIYINTKLLPIVKEIIIPLLEKPDTILKIVNVAINKIINAQDNNEGNNKLLKEILEEIDISAIIRNGKISQFLIQEGSQLARLSNSIIKSEDDDVRILINNLVPVISEITGEILKNSQGVNNLYEVLKPIILGDKKKDISSLDEISDEQKFTIVPAISYILLQDNILPLITKKIPKVLVNNKKAVAKILAENLPKLVETQNSLNSQIIYEPMIEGGIDFIQNILENIPNDKIKSIYSNILGAYNELSNLLNEDNIQIEQGRIEKILENLRNFTKDIAPVLNQTIPDYLTTNKNKIQNILKNIDIDYSIVTEATNLTLTLLPELMVIVSNLATYSLQDQESIKNIIMQAQKLTEASKAEQVNQNIILAQNIIKFINKPGNEKIKEIIENEIPKFLLKNSNSLGPIIDIFINNTVVGRNLEIKGKELLVTSSKKFPQLINIAKYYTNRQYTKFIGTIITLLKDKEILGLVTRAIIDISRYKLQKTFTSLSTRRAKWSKNISAVMDGFQDRVKLVGEKQDLAILLQEQVNSNAKIYSRTIRYSLINKDLSSLILDKKIIPFDNMIIKEFNFKNTLFKDCSFNNSEIINCSFKGANFKNKITFDGAIIDTHSLKTLLPEISKYNQKHPKDPVILQNIKIIGDVDKLNIPNNIQLIIEKNKIINNSSLFNKIDNIRNTLSKYKCAASQAQNKQLSEVEKLQYTNIYNATRKR